MVVESESKAKDSTNPAAERADPEQTTTEVFSTFVDAPFVHLGPDPGGGRVHTCRDRRFFIGTTAPSTNAKSKMWKKKSLKSSPL